MTGPPHWARQQFFNVTQQAVIRRKPNRIFRSPFFQRFVDLRFGKRGIGPKRHFFTPLVVWMPSYRQSKEPSGRQWPTPTVLPFDLLLHL